MTCRIGLIFAIFFAAGAGPGELRTVATTRPAAGIVASWKVRDDPPLRLYSVTVDLTNPAIHIRVCPADSTTTRPAGWETCLLPVSAIAKRENLTVAVNGSLFSPQGFRLIGTRRVAYFRGNPANACGWTVSDGQLWSPRNAFNAWPSFVVLLDGSTTMGVYPQPPETVGQMVSGYAWLVKQGRNVGDPQAPRAPRTAVGLDAKRHTLTLMVVDGRRPAYSVGMTPAEMGDELIDEDVTDAINLDSGGSSTMVLHLNGDWTAINRPSDGHDLPIPISLERPVANALGIVVDPSK